MATITEAEAREAGILPARKRTNKFGVADRADRTWLNPQTQKEEVFDSAAELRRWVELRAMEANREITELRRQDTFEYRGRRGKTLFTYKADFVYRRAGKLNVEDVKGVRTAVYRLKKKLIEDRFGIEIREVTT